MKRMMLGFAVALAAAGAIGATEARRLALADYRDRMEGAWIGQSVGVAYGEPTEFSCSGALVPDAKMPTWKPEHINRTFHQDDLYVEMTFIASLMKHGLEVTSREAGLDFANTTYRLWCANHNARNNLRRGIAAPMSGHPAFHPSTDDIDYQIESDFSGILAPGLPQAAVDLGFVFGRIMNSGDGLFAGQFVGAMYAEAYFETDRVAVVSKALKAIPAASKYAEMVRDMLAWHAAAPTDWKGAWRKAVDKYQSSNYVGRVTWRAIDVKINGAMALLGLLYGDGDLEKTMRIATQGGYDSDCNPSTACGVLGAMLGKKRIPTPYYSALSMTNTWEYTPYDWKSLMGTCEGLARRIVVRFGGRIERGADGAEYFVLPEKPVPIPLRADVVLSEEEKAQIPYLPGARMGAASVPKASVKRLMLYDIVPYAPGREAQTAADIRETQRTTGLDTYLYSVSLDPRGYPAFDHVKAAAASYRKLKQALGKTPVKLGFLLQSILGHWPRVDEKIEPWQRTIDEDGAVKRFCILDPRYQDYIRKTAAALAAEQPCFILGDDDIRAFSPRLECFCPLHTAAFNRRAGTKFTPAAYRAAVKACKDGDQVATVCAQLRDEITLTTTRLIREGIDAVDPKIAAGACMPAAETLLLKPRVKILAGKGNKTTLRFANGKYSEMFRDDFSFNALLTQAYLAHYGADVDAMLDESDTFPHTLYARSGRTFSAKLALNVFNGIRGAKLWFVGMRKGDERVPPAHARELGRALPQLEALAAALDGSTPLGVRIPAVYRTPNLRAGYSDFFGDLAWVTGMLGVYGIPYCADFTLAPGRPVMLCGAATVDRLSDADLKAAFGGKVFVDGPAALRLAARGFRDALGCTPVADGRAFNIERVTATGRCPPMSKTANFPALTAPAANAEVYSELRYSPVGVADGSAAFVAPGALCVKRADGGRTFVAAFDPSLYYQNQNLRRKAWLVGALRALDPAFPVVCENAEPNLTFARRGRDGKTYAITLNTGYDDIEALRYAAAAALEDAEALGEDGAWRPAGALRTADGVWVVPGGVPCMRYRVVRWGAGKAR